MARISLKFWLIFLSLGVACSETEESRSDDDFNTGQTSSKVTGAALTYNNARPVVTTVFTGDSQTQSELQIYADLIPPKGIANVEAGLTVDIGSVTLQSNQKLNDLKCERSHRVKTVDLVERCTFAPIGKNEKLIYTIKLNLNQGEKQESKEITVVSETPSVGAVGTPQAGDGGPILGMLDFTFDNDGYVTDANFNYPSQDVRATAVVTDSVGRIIVVGYADVDIINSKLVMWRYLPNGTLDTTFDGDGRYIDGGTNGKANDAVIDSSGRIVVVGSVPGTSGTDFAVWRFNANGSRDNSFSGDGLATFHRDTDEALAVTLDASGRIVVGGYTQAGLFSDAALLRFEVDGDLDVTFDTIGYVVGAIFGVSSKISDVMMDPAGKILVTGQSLVGMGVARYGMTGFLDNSFDGDGTFVHSGAAGSGGMDVGVAMALDAQGRIVVAGRGNNGVNDDMVVWRINPTGGLDFTFNGTGFIAHSNAAGNIGNDQGYGLMLDSDGKIIVAGASTTGFFDMVVWRLNSNGSLDTSFSGDGFFSHNSAAGGNTADMGFGVARDAQGRILVVGCSMEGSLIEDMAIWRLK